jgi:hypothetical protein
MLFHKVRTDTPAIMPNFLLFHAATDYPHVAITFRIHLAKVEIKIGSLYVAPRLEKSGYGRIKCSCKPILILIFFNFIQIVMLMNFHLKKMGKLTQYNKFMSRILRRKQLLQVLI